MAKISTVPVDPEMDARFDRAFETLSQLVDIEHADKLHPVRANAIYTSSVVLWMLVYQRMNPDTSLEAAVKKLIDSKPAFLPENKRITEGTLSTNTGSYSQARTKLPRSVAEWFAGQVSQSLIDATQPTFGDRRVFLIDGTTITLAPEAELQEEFPPASNQHGEGVWPVALLVVAHELASGIALLPEIGAMYGPQATSETALIHRHLRQLPADGVLMADSGFGIFSVAHAAAQSERSFVLCMTKQRFGALTKQAELVESGDGIRTWSHQWRPTPKVRKAHPDLPNDACLNVRLHEIHINSKLTLMLVTDLPDDAKVLADLYGHRVDVEVDIRNLKVVLDAENIRARSVDTFKKELLGSIVSYNLVSQFRRQSAELVGVSPRRMSFKRTWTTFRQFLLPAMYQDAASWRERYVESLRIAMRDKLPNRPGRSFDRECYPRRPKSNQFKTRKRKPKPD